MSKQRLFRLPDGTVAYLEMHSPAQIIADKGLDMDGSVQAFHTANVLRRIIRYMPYDSGMLIKQTISQTDIHRPHIITDAPEGQFLYHGKLMVGDVTGSAYTRKGETKHTVEQKLTYNHEHNPRAGAYWDRALVASELPLLTHELQSYIDRRSK